MYFLINYNNAQSIFLCNHMSCDMRTKVKSYQYGFIFPY